MSTRSYVGQWTDKANRELKAIYVHFDGYPEGVGQTVLRESRARGPRAVLDILFSKPQGWSSIMDGNFDKPQRMRAHHDEDTILHYDENEGNAINADPDDWGWAEYVYLYDPTADTWETYETYRAGKAMKLIETAPATEAPAPAMVPESTLYLEYRDGFTDELPLREMSADEFQDMLTRNRQNPSVRMFRISRDDTKEVLAQEVNSG